MYKQKHIVVFAAVAALASFGVSQSPPNTQPPVPLYGTGKGTSNVSLAGYLSGVASGLASYDLEGRDIYLKWAWPASGPEPKQFSTQVESTPFWPTEVIGAGPGRVAVAGKRRARTVVELWEFENIPIPAAALDMGTGQYVYPELSVPIEKKRVVFDEATIGLDMVKVMFNIPTTSAGVDASFLAQFYDSRDVYQLDLLTDDNTTCTKVASPVQSGSAMVIPSLSDDGYEGRWAADHPTFGYVYFFTPDAHDVDVNAVGTLVLYDSDRNQSLDGHIVMDVPRWNGPEGWSDLLTYLAVY